MSRYLGDLSLATRLYLDESVSGTTNHVPFHLVRKGSTGILLRHYAPKTKRMHSSNVASYDGCEMDQFLTNRQTGFLSRFDAATLGALAPVTIAYSDYNLTQGGTVSYPEISREIFLLSYTEMGFGGSTEGESILDVLKLINNTTNATTAKITYSEANQTAVNCWMRSASSAAQFRNVGSNGRAGSNDASHTNSYYRPALSVSLDTPVSDEGADEIFLLPEGRQTYWFIGAVAPVGESAVRPAKAKLLVAEHNIQSATYQVSNNAGDTTPVWTPITNGGVAELMNAAKETTNWELAVKIEAEASTPDGYVGEPALVVEPDTEE